MKKLFDFLHSLRKWYWRTFQIETRGARVIIKKDTQVFLVKHRYGYLWVLPGGGMKKGEAPEETARRETKEEVNIEIKSFEKVLGTYSNTQGGKNDTVTVLVANEWEDLGRKFSIEIESSGFFNINNLPDKTSQATKRRIAEYFSREKRQVGGSW